MQTLYDLGTSVSSLGFLSFLLSMTLKGTCILLAAYLITRVLRHAPAATRHAIWSMALVGILILPVATIILPSWRVPLFPISLSETRAEPTHDRSTVNSTGTSDMSAGAILKKETDPRAESTTIRNGSASKGEHLQPVPSPMEGMRSTFPISFLKKYGIIFFLMLWAVGVFIVFIRQLIGRITIWRMAHQSERITDRAWINLFDTLKKHHRIMRPVRLLKSEKTNLPMMWGIFKSTILLPSQADEWPEDQRRFVLLHELAHVKRWDTLTQLFIQLALAFYWFHPMVWIARREFFKEREHACDDIILTEGSKPSEYAGLLLDIASSIPSIRHASLATVAMARPKQLEGRLLAILNPHLNRRTLTRHAVLFTSLVFLFMVIPLSAMRFTTKERPITKKDIMTGEKIDYLVETSTSTDIVQTSNEETEPTPPARKTVKAIQANESDAELPTSEISSPLKQPITTIKPVQQKSQDGDALVIQSLCEALKDPVLEVRLEAAETLGKMKSPDAVQALMSALNDENREMRAAVVDALGDIEDESTVDALITALGDTEWQVRVQAAEALGDIEDRRAVGALGQAVKDENRNVRIAAIEALGDIEDPNALESLSGALKDEDWEIRKRAAEALGDIEDPAAVAPLSGMLSDPHWEVRKTAVYALGEIEDRRAVEPLGKALRDEDWEIRVQAARALGEIEDPSAVAPLSEALTDDNIEVRKAIVWALGEIEDPKAVPPLIEALKDGHWEIRKFAADALGEIADVSAVNALTAHLNDGNTEVRKAVIHALGEIEDPRAVKSLVVLVNDPDWEIRIKVIKALGEIEDPTAVPELIPALTDENRQVRLTAIDAVGELEGRGAVDALIRALDDADGEIRKKAAQALGEIGDPKALEPLSAKLKDESEDVRRAAAKALGEIRWRDE